MIVDDGIAADPPLRPLIQTEAADHSQRPSTCFDAHPCPQRLKEGKPSTDQVFDPLVAVPAANPDDVAVDVPSGLADGQGPREL